jgi:hypothetical protein
MQGNQYKGYDYAGYGDPDTNNDPMNGNWDKIDTGWKNL